MSKRDERLADAIEARAEYVYPKDVFAAPTSRDYAEINSLLKAYRGHALDAIAADCYRRAHASIAADLRAGRLDQFMTEPAKETR